MKAVSAALGVLAFATSVLAAPQAEARKSFPFSTKKGLSYNTASYTNAFNLAWAYNWGENPNADTGTAADTGSLRPGVEFTPMLWGSDATNWTVAADAAIAAGAKHLLGFNEPDNAGQSNITPATAAQLWIEHMEPYAGKVKLVGPAVTNGGGVQWLQQFLGNCTECTIDAIAMHWYDSATFAGSGTVAQQQSFFSYILPWMETQRFIERYAGFGDFSGTYVNDDGSLTDLGRTYAETLSVQYHLRIVEQKKLQEPKAEVKVWLEWHQSGTADEARFGCNICCHGAAFVDPSFLFLPMSHPAPTAPTILLPEILGFSPQLLLDDVINSANSAVTASVDGMEMFLLRWADGRAKEGKGKSEDDITQEIEQGLVAFQTLLESHVDIAFDFFELWSLRNIFAVPADLPIVVPHHKGLDLESPPEKETELMAEIDDLRQKIDNQRRLKRLYTRAARKSRLQLKHSQSQLEMITFLRSPQLQILGALPASLTQMCDEVASLPAQDPTSAQLPLPDPGKRPWEMNKTGYFQWAVGQSLARGTGDNPQGASAISRVAEAVQTVGTAGHVKAAAQFLDNT
ncbi:hypothetical protein HWV62_40244 [Athelia sp. TMB]|nr:hypothetical protein HWV62_40244 [Athelia sp. TMB]